MSTPVDQVANHPVQRQEALSVGDVAGFCHVCEKGRTRFRDTQFLDARRRRPQGERTIAEHSVRRRLNGMASPIDQIPH